MADVHTYVVCSKVALASSKGRGCSGDFVPSYCHLGDRLILATYRIRRRFIATSLPLRRIVSRCC